MTVCVTGATGFIGSHLAQLASESLGPVRVTYRDERRLERLGHTEVEPIRADVLDRGALRRAFRGCEIVFHAAGYVGSRPSSRVWEVNALSPRVAVEAAAAEDVRRVVVTSSVAGIGPAPLDRPGTEDDPYRGGGPRAHLPGLQARGRVGGAGRGRAPGGGGGDREPVLRLRAGRGPHPSGRDLQPADRQLPAGPASRGGGLGDECGGRSRRGQGPSAGRVRRGARGALRARRPRPALGGADRAGGALSGVHHPLVVLPREAGALARRAEELGLPSPVAGEGVLLMSQNWRYSSRKARRDLGYRARPLDRTLRDTIAWYLELIQAGALSGRPSPLSLAAAGVRIAGRVGLLSGLRVAERYTGRRLVIRG